ncbi:hypothetical protein E2C01_054285 [Portunus trituberculatus]|uniref:Uncharacterized protein n=1 Tax=Portunus trituberculatus TaxID=210409 RepID=A0A5B7GRJ8_PORTR|nr:hypothetical protein [Portunus trituberculatus]
MALTVLGMQDVPSEGHWWSLGQQKLSGHCMETVDPIWQWEDSGSDGVKNHTQKLLLLAGRQFRFGPVDLKPYTRTQKQKRPDIVEA